MSSDDERSSPSDTEKRDEDTIKILLATDCHLGYEKTTKRNLSDDSFVTFEEILQYAVEYDVDFILLGGDLFHESKPKQDTVLKCMNLLKKYCLGSREIKIQFLTDPNVIFNNTGQNMVNFEDPNLNIDLPMFSIHGNHDDPSNDGIGSMDVLSMTGLVNYFGKWTNLSNIEIPPLVFQKGTTKLALYGLSYINDQRLSRLIRDNKLHLIDDFEDSENCFKMFVLHQNRVRRAEHGHVPEDKLPKSLDFIMWGHEHECRIEPEFYSVPEYYICQPGSSVATSLCPGEAVSKSVGFLKVHGKEFALKALKLNTVRPFVFKEIKISDYDISNVPKLSDNIYKFVEKYIEETMFPEASSQLTGHKLQPLLPLLRLRIIFDDDAQQFNSLRLTQRFCDEVANPGDLIIWKKQRSKHRMKGHMNYSDSDDEIGAESSATNKEHRSVQERVQWYFAEKKNDLTTLSISGLNHALTRCAEKDDITAFNDIIKHQLSKTMEYVEQFEITNDEDIMEKTKEFRNLRTEAKEEEELVDFFKNKPQELNPPSLDTSYNSDSEQDVTTPAVRGRGRGRGRARGSRARGKN